MQGTPVKKTSVLVTGATGTLGRQVVRQLLSMNYQVKVLLRPRIDRPYSFLLDWGATIVEGTLVRGETVAPALVGVHTIIDCATARPEEQAYTTDWQGKKCLIQCAKAMGIQRYIFFSIKDCDQHENVPLMKLKTLTEDLLKKSKMRYTVLRLTGFMQPLISQYALAILNDQAVWCDDGSGQGIAYLDSQDCALMTAAVLNQENTIGRTLMLSGPKVWKAQEVIKLAEELSGRMAEVNPVPTAVVQLTQMGAASFQWTRDVAERLRFVEVSESATTGKLMTQETYDLLGMDPGRTRTLEAYFGEYYKRVFKKLSGQTLEQPAEKKLEAVSKPPSKDVAALPSEAADLPPEQEVFVEWQEEVSRKLEDYYLDLEAKEMEKPANNDWFGWVPVAEVVNGRSSMMGFAIGMFTEWATGDSMPQQVDILVDNFTSMG